VIAGLTNAEVAVDPDGILPVGAEVKVPYDLNEGDTRCDVILLTPYADVLHVALIAPDGTLVNESNGATLVRTPNQQAQRLPLPTPAVAGPVAGRWYALLRIDWHLAGYSSMLCGSETTRSSGTSSTSGMTSARRGAARRWRS
jgi:hypothetical protein